MNTENQTQTSQNELTAMQYANLMMELEKIANDDLIRIKGKIEDILGMRSSYEIIELSYNHYKGTGKCWIAKVDSETKKILSFLDCESRQPRDNYSGKKTFKVPLIEGTMYLFNDSGSKSKDDREYKTVQNNQLI